MADENILNVEIVAEDHQVWSGQARSVSARTIDGEVGILPGHTPMLAVLGDGEVVVETADGSAVVAEASGGSSLFTKIASPWLPRRRACTSHNRVPNSTTQKNIQLSEVPWPIA